MSEDSAPREAVDAAGEEHSSEASAEASGVAEAAPSPPPPRSALPSDAKVRRVTLLLAIIIVVGLPAGVGLATLLSPAPRSAAPTEEPATLAGLAADRSSRATPSDPSPATWTRPSWADGYPDVTVFELSAQNDVPFVNGRHRPALGIICMDGRTDVHVTTGGTAPIDAATSGHVVSLNFDNRGPEPQRWGAGPDQRSLFAPNALRVAGQIASAQRLRLEFTHYLTGPVEVEFDLRDANRVITSMAEPCGWVG